MTDPSVLLVEDSPSDARVIEAEIEQTDRGDYELTWVESLQDALEHASEHTVDAILLDLYLPDSQGLDTVETMHDKFPDAPLIVLTSHEDEQAGREAVRAGAQDYLIKGKIDGTELARAITYAIERRQSRRELEQLRKQVAMNEKLASLGALVSGMTEQVRSSTTEITNALFQIRQRIQETARSNPQMTDLVEDVADANAAALDGVNRIDELMRDLGQFTQGPKGVATVGIHAPVRDACELYRKTHATQLELVTEIDEIPERELNVTQIQQVVLNLLRNGADAMPSGGTLKVRTYQEGNEGVIEVEDTGEGMTSYVHQRMFDPFYSTREDGDGLGLPIARRIVENHGGSIECDTEKGEGTTFTVRLPTESSS